MLRATQQGFTLIEVMLAMAIFAVLSLLTYQILGVSLQSQETVEEHSETLNQLQRTFTVMERDLTQILPRRNQPDQPLLDLSSTELGFTTLDVTRATQPLAASDLVAVRWQLTGESLTRSTLPLPARPGGEFSAPRIMLDNVTSLSWRFFDQSWQPEWPSTTAWPKAVEIVAEVKGVGEVRRLFLLPDTLQKRKKAPSEAQPASSGGAASPAKPSAQEPTR